MMHVLLNSRTGNWMPVHDLIVVDVPDDVDVDELINDDDYMADHACSLTGMIQRDR